MKADIINTTCSTTSRMTSSTIYPMNIQNTVTGTEYLSINRLIPIPTLVTAIIINNSEKDHSAIIYPAY